MSDVTAGFLGGLGQGLIDTGKYVVKRSFEDKAYERKQEVDQRMWEERNAVTAPQATALKELDLESRRTAAKTVATAKMTAAEKTAKAKVSAAKKLAAGRVAVQNKKIQAGKDKIAAADKKTMRVDSTLSSALSDSESSVKALMKRFNEVQLGGKEEDLQTADILKRQIAAVKIRRDTLREITQLQKAGQKEQADMLLGNFFAKYGKKAPRARFKQ